MSDFIVEGLDHVSITTPEELEEEVLAFYERSLGLKRLVKPEGTRQAGGWFAIGDTQLHVSRDSHNPPVTQHFAVKVDAFDAVVAHLRGAGFHIEQARPIPRGRRFFTRDPAGNRVEIVSYDR